MILETRHLVFTNPSLRQALAWYATAPGQTDLPHGVITAVTPRAGGGLTVSVQQSGASKIRDVSFTASKTLGVLLYFCRKQRVPVPRDAHKDLSIEGDAIVLTIQSDTPTSGP
ncbi:hypothetical protein [Azospirillum halopraeferens]|uniref:hypothetical protein n=1 Tax=Azospirillum halopraeferens TaxID=34010 RepID=UPI000401359C|nr:hypothetical protein [Azospirillum halopraeferens]